MSNIFGVKGDQKKSSEARMRRGFLLCETHNYTKVIISAVCVETVAFCFIYILKWSRVVEMLQELGSSQFSGIYSYECEDLAPATEVTKKMEGKLVCGCKKYQTKTVTKTKKIIFLVLVTYIQTSWAGCLNIAECCVSWKLVLQSICLTSSALHSNTSLLGKKFHVAPALLIYVSLFSIHTTHKNIYSYLHIKRDLFSITEFFVKYS